MVFIKKVYGESKAESCYFCDKRATTENSLGIPTCFEHKSKNAENQKCACGKTLEIRKSKFGAFFVCASCGPVSLKKAKDTKSDFSEYNINKKYRAPEKKLEPKYEKDRIYTLDELEEMWEK